MDSQTEDRKSRMDQANISRQPPHPRRSRRDQPAFQARFEQALARFEQALRKLPLAEPDITAVAEKLATKLAHFRSNTLSKNRAFFNIRRKVTAVCDHFADEGLTLRDYLRAARRQPQLFIKSPATVIANIERVVAHFSRFEMMRRRYLHAALKSPILFAMNPDTVIASVEVVVKHFASDGLIRQQYLEAALKQPQLFYQPPSTVMRHFNYLIDMHRAGLLTFRGQANGPPKQPLRPLFAFLLRRPRYLILGDDNYALRIRYAEITGERPGGTELLDLRRRHIEEALARTRGLSHANLQPGNGEETDRY